VGVAVLQTRRETQEYVWPWWSLAINDLICSPRCLSRSLDWIAMNILSKNGELIQSVEEWKAKAPPKQGDKHWKDDRSAKELARAWFRPSPPAELLTLLHDTFPTDKIILTDAYPECVVRLDDLRGEHRNTDLLVLGVAGIRKLAVSIEAKADEASAANAVNIMINNVRQRVQSFPKGWRLSAKDCLARIWIPISGRCPTSSYTELREQSSRPKHVKQMSLSLSCTNSFRLV
jgi:hypothetical protein